MLADAAISIKKQILDVYRLPGPDLETLNFQIRELVRFVD